MRCLIYLRAHAKKVLEMAKPTKKNPAAAALANERWKKTPKSQRTEIARQVSKSRWDNATQEEKAEIGRRLAEARAKKRGAKKNVKRYE